MHANKIANMVLEMNDLINHSTSQSINQSILHSINPSILHLSNQSPNLLMNGLSELKE